MGDADGDGGVPAARGDGVRLGAEFDEPALGVGEADSVSAADLVEGAGSGDGDDAPGEEAAGGLVDLGGGGHGEGDAAETVAFAAGEGEDVVFFTGAAQPGGVAVLLDGFQTPHLGVEVGGLGEGGGVQLDGAQGAQPGDGFERDGGGAGVEVLVRPAVLVSHVVLRLLVCRHQLAAQGSGVVPVPQ